MRMHLRRKGFFEHQIDSKNREGNKNDEHAYVWPMQYVCMSRRQRKRDTDKEREMGREEQLLCFSVVI